MSLLQINTAIPLAKPLLDDGDDDDDLHNNNHNNNNNNNNNHNHNNPCGRTKCVLVGILTGFVIQIVSLGAYACLLMEQNNDGGEGSTSDDGGGILFAWLQHHHDDNDDVDGSDSTASGSVGGSLFGTDAISSTLLSILTQVDLMAYVLIWVAFTAMMTKHGMDCIGRSFFDDDSGTAAAAAAAAAANGENGRRSRLRRHVFLGGVAFLVGVVLGAFGAWTAVDCVMGYPIPLEPILATVGIDMVLCYMMVCCYDFGATRNLGDDDDDDEIDDVETCDKTNENPITFA